MVRLLLTAVCVVSLLFCIAVPSNATSLVGCLNNGIETRQDLEVRVKHDGKPLEGVTVRVTSKGTEQFSEATSVDGSVHMNLPPGDYWLKAELLGISAAYECFHISEQSSRNAKRRLTYDWGDLAPATRRIAGNLVDSQPGKGGTPIWNLLHYTDVPISGASLKLQDPITGAAYTTTTGHGGDFAFDLIPNGTYVLHIEGGTADEQGYDASVDLLIKLDPSASRDMLLLRSRDARTSLELQLQDSNSVWPSNKN